MRRPALLLVLPLLALGAGACGSSGGSSAGAGAGSGDAGDGGSGPRDSSGPSAPYYGTVTFLDGFEFNTTDVELDATFFATPAGGAPGLCPAGAQQSGACCIFPPRVQAIALTPVSAGALTLTDSSKPGNPAIGVATFVISQAPGVPNGYSVGTASSFDWSAGDTLTVSAAGDPAGVGAFAGSVVAPVALSGVAPSPGSSTSPLMVPTQSDFVVTWTAGQAPGSQVELEIDDQSDSANFGGILCMTGDAAGRLTVPVDLLREFQVAGNGIITVTRLSAGVLSSPASNATVTLYAGSTPVSGYMAFE